MASLKEDMENFMRERAGVASYENFIKGDSEYALLLKEVETSFITLRESLNRETMNVFYEYESLNGAILSILVRASYKQGMKDALQLQRFTRGQLVKKYLYGCKNKCI
ncbi:MAG: hypothetical protein NHB14_01430 [Desulfosporosinus sp.]|nr:hypothetical protein [Desulfosporosinus sp.]